MLKKISPREKLLLIMLGLAALVMVTQKLILAPALAEYREAKGLLEQRNKEIAFAGELLMQQGIEEQGVREARFRLASLKEELLNRAGADDLLVRLGMEAIKSRVKIILFKPMMVADRKFYLEFPARIKISGLFPDVLDYLVKLEDSKAAPGLLEIRDLKIKNKNRLTDTRQGGFNQAQGSVEAEFVLLFYTLPDLDENGDAISQKASGWNMGRTNAFVFPGSASPFLGVPGMALPIEATAAFGVSP